jgi:hypothetical protein
VPQATLPGVRAYGKASQRVQWGHVARNIAAGRLRALNPRGRKPRPTCSRFLASAHGIHRDAEYTGMHNYLVALLDVGLSTTGGGNAAPSPMSGFPIELRIPVASTLITAGGEAHLVCELHMTILSGKLLELTRLEVFGDDSAIAIASYDASELDRRRDIRASLEDPAKRRSLAAGTHGVVYLDAVAGGSARQLRGLRHRLSFGCLRGDGERVEKSVDGAQVAVRPRAPLAIGPPLRGSGWPQT